MMARLSLTALAILFTVTGFASGDYTGSGYYANQYHQGWADHSGSSDRICSPKEYYDSYWLTSEGLNDEQLQILNSNDWLDNSIMNSYMNLLQRDHSDVFAMDVYFYVQLDARLDYARIEDIVEDKEMLSKHPDSSKLKRLRMILVPALINGYHWTLVVVEPNRRLVTFYDSLGSKTTTIAAQVRSYFARLFGESESAWRIVIASNIPRQTNGYDCGVFVLKFADNLINKRSLTFSQTDVSSERRIIKQRLFKC